LLTERDPKIESISSKNTIAGVFALACRNTFCWRKKKTHEKANVIHYSFNPCSLHYYL
jgi:hypothetical protein